MHHRACQLVLLALIPVCALTTHAAAAAERRVDLERRERELAARPRQVVAADVRQRAQELGVGAPAETLTDLLYRIARLELDLERCALALAAGRCAGPQQDRERVEAEFLHLTGWRAADFKRGKRGFAASAGDRPPLAAGRAAARIFAADSTRTDPSNCLCSVSIANLNRWINRYWGLECACHTGHGVCSDDLDWCGVHDAGHGAMTGEVRAYFGNDLRGITCPDDHKTCFKGNLPSPDKPGGAQWSNVCNCDTQHAQLDDANQQFYGGDVAHDELINQATFWDLLGDGPCDYHGVYVEEHIEENDPWCCDDGMGTLTAWAVTPDGTTVTDVPASAENCNGGSQSGQWPNCGTFGATIRVTSNCTTRADDSYGSCSGRCGQLLPDATCNCDFDCQSYGDCCPDYCNECSATGENPGFPCSSS